MLRFFLCCNAIETTVQNVNNVTSMSDELKGVILTAAIQIIGFIVTYIGVRSSLKDELKKQKSNIALNKMTTIPYSILNLQEDVIKKSRIDNEIRIKERKNNLSREEKIDIEKKKKLSKEIDDGLYDRIADMLNTIYSYGSEDAIKIASKMQNEAYKRNGVDNVKETPVEQQARVTAFYILLATQVKYDVTAIANSPELWYQMRMNDYDEKKEIYIKATNKLIEKLELNNEFII